MPEAEDDDADSCRLLSRFGFARRLHVIPTTSLEAKATDSDRSASTVAGVCSGSRIRQWPGAWVPGQHCETRGRRHDGLQLQCRSVRIFAFVADAGASLLPWVHRSAGYAAASVPGAAGLVPFSCARGANHEG